MARFLRFAMYSAIMCSSLLTTPAAVSRGEAQTISGSTDVAWLESIVTSVNVTAKMATPGLMARGAKDYRTAAYTRLGELGTAESLAAIDRIERAARMMWRKRSVGFDRWTHPSWHFGDFQEDQKVATLDVGGGLTYTVIHDAGLLGDNDWFLLSAPSSRWAEWQGPWLIPKPASLDSRTLNLVFSQGLGILIAFTRKPDALLEPMNPVAAGCLPKISLEGVTTLVSAKEIQQDSDGDGWTDLEEDRLGLDSHNIDSDGDGLTDLQDGCPDYAPGPEEAHDERLKVLQKAIFAAFGLSGSRDAIFVNQGSPKLQVWGYEGPILYNISRKDWAKDHSTGIWVTWRVTSLEGNEAEVGIQDYEGPLAAGGQSVSLHRISGEWYATKRTTGPVS